eukprot:5558823-Pyramimonas_sp.AAC.1
MARHPPPPPLLVRSVSLYVFLFSIARQLSWEGLLNGLAGIREAETIVLLVVIVVVIVVIIIAEMASRSVSDKRIQQKCDARNKHCEKLTGFSFPWQVRACAAFADAQLLKAALHMPPLLEPAQLQQT